MALKEQDLATAIFNQITAKVVNAQPPPPDMSTALQHLSDAIATALATYIPQNLDVTTPANEKCTVA